MEIFMYLVLTWGESIDNRNLQHSKRPSLQAVIKRVFFVLVRKCEEKTQGLESSHVDWSAYTPETSEVTMQDSIMSMAALLRSRWNGHDQISYTSRCQVLQARLVTEASKCGFSDSRLLLTPPKKMKIVERPSVAIFCNEGGMLWYSVYRIYPFPEVVIEWCGNP